MAYQACTDCVFAAVNNDFPEDDARADEVRRGLAAWSGYILGFADDDEFFSWRGCDVCGSPLGGTYTSMKAVPLD